MSVSERLIDLGHDVVLSKDAVGVDAPDHIVATLAATEDRILVSHDHDMKRIERFISVGHKKRYPTLSLLMLCCPEVVAVQRVEQFLPHLELELELARAAGHPMLVHIRDRSIRINR